MGSNYIQWYYGTLTLVINSFQNSWQVPKPTNTKLFTGDNEADASTSVSSQEKGSEWQASPKHWNIFSHQNVTSTGFDEFWSQQVPRHDYYLNVLIHITYNQSHP